MKKYRFLLERANVKFVQDILTVIEELSIPLYIYLSEFYAIPSNNGNSQADVLERDSLIDFSSKIRFNHYTLIALADFSKLLHKCDRISDLQFIAVSKMQSVEELYQLFEVPNSSYICLEIEDEDIITLQFPEKFTNQFETILKNEGNNV